VGHAYIFEGEENAVTRSFALDFAKGLNCLEANDTVFDSGTRLTSGCNCLSCRTFDSANHPDTIFVTGTKQKGIGVDDVRAQVLLPMAHKPFRYNYKVFIVDKAETLTPAAQNALLKTIEEPAPYGFFLFITTHTHNFLPTVLSRCVIRKVRGGQNISIDVDPALKSLAEDIAARVGGLDVYDAFALYRHFEPLSKEAVQQLLDLLYTEFGRKISHAAETGQPPEQTWFNSAAAITKTKQILAQNGNAQLAIELMLNKMQREPI